MKLKYKPSRYDSFSSVLYLGIGIPLLIYGINSNANTGPFDYSPDTSTNFMIFGLSIYSISIGLYKIYQHSVISKLKTIVLSQDSLKLPEKNNGYINNIQLSDVTSIKIHDIYIDIETDTNQYSIDCSWIKDKKNLDILIKKLQTFANKT